MKLEIGNWKLENRKSKTEARLLLGRRPRTACADPSPEFRISSFEFRVSSFSGWGFTLLELMMVMTLIVLLASFAVPPYHAAVVRAREAVLRNDLYTMRKLIDQFTLDKQRPPASLDELVEGGYLRGGIPKDPFTGSEQTWHVDSEDTSLTPDQTSSGIVDVHSGSDDISVEGTPYSSW